MLPDLLSFSSALGSPERMESNWAERTITVSGFPEDILPNTVMTDKLIIHFLRPRNSGGEVESVTYPADAPGIAYVTFEKEEANIVLRKKEQVLEDKQLPMKYPLKVSQNNVQIFTQVSVDLDLSIFGSTSKLVTELESNNKSLQFSRCPDGRIHVEGSFSAMKELRKDLQKRIDEFQVFPSPVLKSGVSASGGKFVSHTSEDAAQGTEPQKLAASASYGARDVLHPGLFEEESTVILDADIFDYIEELCKDHYEEVLRKNCVRAEVKRCDVITLLQLKKAHDQCEPSQLKTAKLSIEKLINQMQQLLVSEKIRLDRGSGQNKILEICRETMQHNPSVLVRITDEYLILIGSSQHCSQFKKEVEERIKAVQSILNPMSSGHSSIPNATDHFCHFGQSLGSNAVHGLCVSSGSECSLNQNSHFGQLMKSQEYSGGDSHGKWRSSRDVGVLASGPPSLPVLGMSSSTIQDRQSKDISRSEKSSSSVPYHSFD
ncbi:RNA-binding protein 43-like isoform X2 [Carcharodon carcharias]|uniref:RNA-binding protein 43-like isoform X2 n=1 Tax=Carcharodon carcharias TaxID=13397 RepID=UPI001B7F06DC|nr:RNA-binding protein 43-like isoform X2 [Carcharodon carcharias]